MKKFNFLAALLLMVAGVQTAWGQKMVVTMEDNSKVEYDITKVKDILFVEAEADEHGWVDLGLPSGTLWATCNVGANSPEEYGDYFAWGETEPKSEYNWGTYKWCKGSNETLTKYCRPSSYGYNGFTDTLTELLPEDDAAMANWRSGWNMPSFDQIEELINSEYTTAEWTRLDGVYGRKITGPNGNSIFLPAAGDHYGTSLSHTGSYGYYWSRSFGTGKSCDARSLFFSSGRIVVGYYNRCYGHSVRPVRVK